MRTNVVIDDKLIEEGLAYTGLKTKKELVNYALKELVCRKKRKAILELEGKLHWEGDLEEMRGNRFENIS
ncbi:MAG: type II toxin-antitoxin system VapB family antitoxin [Desulfobacterales bacterium]